MAKPTLKKDTAGPSVSPPGTSASSSAPPRRPRLTKTNVVKAILQLGDTRGSTMQSILTKLRRRPGSESITKVQLQKAITRLMEDHLVRAVKEERFFLSTDTKKSTAKKQKTANTKTASTASPSAASSTVAKVRAVRTTKAADVKTRATRAVAVKTRPTKSRSVAVSLARKQSSNCIKSSSPRKADRDCDVGSARKNARNSRRHGNPVIVTSGKMEVSVVDIPPEGIKVDVDVEADSSALDVGESNTADTDNLEGGRVSIVEPVMSTPMLKI